jgi:GAG-polyprotein viral zinc-finger
MPPNKQMPTKTVVVERVVTTKETRTEYKSEPKKTKPTHGECYRCGRDSHWKPDCYAKTHLDGSILDDADNEESEKDEEEWGCQYCSRSFTTRFGCMVHERSCCK